MSAERPIEVGDLVQVVRVCCDKITRGTLIYRVAILHAHDEILICKHCHAELPDGMYAAEKSQYGAPIGWLKRIPPLSELEGERTDESVSACARPFPAGT